LAKVAKGNSNSNAARGAGYVKRFDLRCESHSNMEEPLDSRQLKAFVILSKTGSYTQTAKHLCVTHSAISHAMRALEDNVGCRLLSRMGKKIILTHAGEALLHHTQNVLEEMRQARLTLSGLNKWGFRRLRIGSEAALGRYFLTDTLVKFRSESPQTLMQVEVLGSAEPRVLLETSRVDLVLAEKPVADDTLEFIPLFADRFHIVVNPAHPWAIKGSVPRDELPRQPCVLYRTSNHTRRMLDEYLGRGGIVLNKIIEMDDAEAVKEFVKQMQCMSILPGWTFKAERKQGSLTALALGRKAFDQTWGFTHWRGRALSLVESSFLKLCMSTVAALD
jgi:DNA-binding transcriptional LysR family regulator